MVLDNNLKSELQGLYTDGYSKDFSYMVINSMISANRVETDISHVSRQEVRDFMSNINNSYLVKLRNESKEYVFKRTIENRGKRDKKGNKFSTYRKNRENSLLYRITNDNKYYDRIKSP